MAAAGSSCVCAIILFLIVARYIHTHANHAKIIQYMTRLHTENKAM